MRNTLAWLTPNNRERPLISGLSVTDSCFVPSYAMTLLSGRYGTIFGGAIGCIRVGPNMELFLHGGNDIVVERGFSQIDWLSLSSSSQELCKHAFKTPRSPLDLELKLLAKKNLPVIPLFLIRHLQGFFQLFPPVSFLQGLHPLAFNTFLLKRFTVNYR